MPDVQLPALLRQIRQSAEPDGRGPSDAQLLQRFLRYRDEAAFTALVSRHGRLVLGVCRRVLGHAQDAEDAFQATFLCLARRAASLRSTEALGSWLYRVAYRIAVKAGVHMARRRTTERQASPRSAATSPAELDWRELEAVVQQELESMAAKFRGPFVLCCLEGKSRTEAAAELGWKEGTVAGRLAQARKLLQQGLTRRGLTLSTLLSLAALARPAAAAVPARLGRLALRIALQAANGGDNALIPPRIATLAEGAPSTMLTGKLKTATALLLTLAFAAAGGLLARPSSAARPAEKPPAATPRPPQRDPKAADPVAVTGTVVAADGKPLAGARLFVRTFSPKVVPLPVQATSDGAGKFRFTFDRSKLDPTQTWMQVIAVADGRGPDWVTLGERDSSEGLTLRLTGSVPLRGRILDLDGKPVTGARLRVDYVRRYKGDDLAPFFQTVRDGEFPPVPDKWWSGPFPGQPQEIVTGANGRIRLDGVGADSEVRFSIEGPGIQYASVRAVGRDLKAALVPKEPNRVNKPYVEKVYGATFVHAVAPSRPIRGVVRDRKTGKPVGSVAISGPPLSTTHHTTTDKEGRYELKGYPKSSAGYDVHAAAGGLPYFDANTHVADTHGLDPVKGDIELVGGLVVRGKVTLQATGKPVAGAWVDYNPLFPNLHVARLGLKPGQSGTSSSTRTGPDGRYTLVVLPGPGALGFGAYLPKQLLMPACVTEQDLRDFFKDKDYHGGESSLMTQAGPQTMGLMGQNRYNLLILIRPDEKAESLRHDVALVAERTLRGRVAGPDGKPLPGVRVYGLQPQSSFGADALKDDTFVVQGFNPRRQRELVFVHPEKRLGAYLMVRGAAPRPLVVRLQPCGTVTGCILDRDGRPVGNAVVRVDRRLLLDSGPKVRTDRNGRFQVDGLVPGQKYAVRVELGRDGKTVFDEVLLKPGENRDLGNARSAE